MSSDLVDEFVPDEPAYTFLRAHTRVETDGVCQLDREQWPCLVARAFFAGRRAGLDIAAARLDALAEGFVAVMSVQRVRRVAAHLHVDAEQIDEGLRAAQAERVDRGLPAHGDG